MTVINGRVELAFRLRSVPRDHVPYDAGGIVHEPGGFYVGRYRARVGLHRFSQVLSVHQQIIIFTGLNGEDPPVDLVFDLDAGRFVKYPVEQDGLQLVRQVGPVPSYCFHPDDFHPVAIAVESEPRVSLGPSPFAVPPHGWQQKPVVVLFQFQFEERGNAIPLLDVLGKPFVDTIAHRATEPKGFTRIGKVRRVQIDENRVGIPIQHLVAVFLQLVAAPPQNVVAEFGDRAGQLGRGESAGSRRQHAVERIHDDLVGEGSKVVAAGLGLLAAFEELLQHGGQNAGRSGESRAVGRGKTVIFVHLVPCLDMGQGIDVEGSYDGRIEALEIKDEYVPVQPCLRWYDEPARRTGARGAVHSRRRRHHAALMQCIDVDIVEGGHAHPGAFQWQAREQSPAQGKVDQPFRFQDVENQPGILQAIGAEEVTVLAIDFRDLLRPRIPRILFKQLSPAQDCVGHRAQPVVIEPLQRAAQEMQGIQDLAPVDDHGAAAPNFAGPVPGLVRRPAELKRHVQVPEAPLQHFHIEVDQVPSGEQVGIHFAQPRRHAAKHRRLVGPADQGGRVTRSGRAHHVDLFRFDARDRIREDQADGVNGGRFRIRFDVQSQYAE